MKKFSKEMTCPKCGGDDLHHRYKKKGERLEDNLCIFDKAECELIRTACRCCGYRWSSLTLDAAEVEAEPDQAVYISGGASASSILAAKNATITNAVSPLSGDYPIQRGVKRTG